MCPGSGGVDELDEAAIAGQLGVIEQAARQLEARRCRLASGLAARRTDRARLLAETLKDLDDPERAQASRTLVAAAEQSKHTAVQGERATAGVVETTWLGPLPFAEIRRLLSDAGVARLLIDPAGVPLEAGEDVRTVPAGLWRALQARDQGCIADGCDTPAAWCDVMHLDRPDRLNGRLTLDTAGLGCRHHHRCLDLNNWHVNWHNRRPTIRPPT